MGLYNTIDAMQKKYSLSGLQIATIKNGDIHANFSIGNSLMDSRIKLKNDDLFRIASISKLLVSICIMKAKEDGLVQLDTDVSSYIGFTVRNPYHSNTPITIRQLLSHTSSLTDTNGTKVPLGRHISELISEQGSQYSNQLFLVKDGQPSKPGTFFEYCNLAFGVLATILECVYQERFDICVSKIILKKLNMIGSFHISDLDRSLIKPLYRFYDGAWKEEVDGEDFISQYNKIDFSSYKVGTNGTIFNPQGGFRTNATELLKLMNMFLSDSNPVLCNDSIEEMCQIVYKNSVYPVDKEQFIRNSGLGPNIILPQDTNSFVRNQRHNLIGHTGLAYGFMGLFFFNRETKNGMIVLSLGHKEPLSAYKGSYSTYFNFQEEIGTLLYREIFHEVTSSIIQSTPKKDGFFLPAEFTPQDKVYLIWPTRTDVWVNNAKDAQGSVIALATAIAKYTTVTLCVSKAAYTNLLEVIPSNIDLVVLETNDAWMRDIGPIFVVNNNGERRIVDWKFNAWGGTIDGLYECYDLDQKVPEEIGKIEGIDRYVMRDTVLEGGAITVDGQGTLITTESCLLSDGRNKGKTKTELEKVLSDYLGISKVIWLKRGIDPYETNGHVDMIVSYVRPGEIMMIWTEDKSHIYYEICQEIYLTLSSSKDSKGNQLIIHKLPLPQKLIYYTAKEIASLNTVKGTAKRTIHDVIPASYINFLITNNAVIVPQFGDANDNLAIQRIQSVFPNKEVFGVDTLAISKGGGNIHCMTQQMPAVVSTKIT